MTRKSYKIGMMLTFALAMSTGVFAQYGGGSGTSSDPYQISTAAHLAALATNVNGGNAYSGEYFILTTDIDLCVYNAANTAFNGGKGWIPIGKNAFPFKGVFDGGGKKITGLYINDEEFVWGAGLGLFGLISDATVKNVALVNASINAFDGAGGIAAMVTQSDISNCYVSGNIKGKDGVGGIVGTISQVVLSNCYSAANVTGHGFVGGVLGALYNEGEITNCYSTGVVVAGGNLGGIVGQVAFGTSNTKVSNCAALNPCIKGGASSTGRIVGQIESGTLTLSNNIAFDSILNKDGNTTWTHKGAADLDGTDISQQTINIDGTLGNRFIATNGWTIANGKLPGLFNNTVDMPLLLMICYGTSTDPFMIATAEHLAQLATLVKIAHPAFYDKYYMLANNIDLSKYGTCFNDGKGWIPIGWYDDDNYIAYPFSGTFDGNNKKITGLYIDAATLSAIGLFGVVDGGTIKNVGVENVNISGNGAVGGVVGGADHNSSVINCYSTGNVNGNYDVGGVVGGVFDGGSLSDCYSTSDVNGTHSVGGVVGQVLSSNVTNCYSTGNISGYEAVGGVAGFVWYSSNVTNCYSTGTVSGDNRIGGVVGGISNSSSVTDCYSTGGVSGNYDVGGVAGYFSDCTINNCYSTGDVNGDYDVGGIMGYTYNSSISDCYSTGAVSGIGAVGGIAGDDDENSISNCYSIGAVSGTGEVGGITGYTYNCSISNCAALNPSAKGDSDVGRITGYVSGTTTFTNNIAFDSMLNQAGNSTWSDKGLTAKDGGDITKEIINIDGTLGSRFTASVWTTKKGSLPGLFGNTVAMPEHLRLPGMVYIITKSLPDGKVGVFYSATLTANGYTPISWNIGSGLPTGLALNANTGEISGTPTTKGTFTFTVKAVNSVGDDSKELSIIIGDGVGIETITNDKLRMTIYPNPAKNGELRVSLPSPPTPKGGDASEGGAYEAYIQIYSVVGQMVCQINKSTNQQINNIIIDISHLANGIYFLKIGNQVTKFIKE